MEAVATFCILFFIYFLGILALIQLVIRPVRRVEYNSAGSKKLAKTNHLQILVISMMLSLATTTLAYWIFP
jgi:ABC-type transport system involved in cytochrome c biogenesis permease subunit